MKNLALSMILTLVSFSAFGDARIFNGTLCKAVMPNKTVLEISVYNMSVNGSLILDGNTAAQNGLSGQVVDQDDSEKDAPYHIGPVVLALKTKSRIVLEEPRSTYKYDSESGLCDWNNKGRSQEIVQVQAATKKVARVYGLSKGMTISLICDEELSRSVQLPEDQCQGFMD